VIGKKSALMTRCAAVSIMQSIGNQLRRKPGPAILNRLGGTGLDGLLMSAMHGAQYLAGYAACGEKSGRHQE